MIQNEPHYFHKKLINIFPLYSAYPWLLPVSLRQLNKLVSRLCSQLEKYGHVPGFIDLYLVNDKYIASANKEYLGCPGPTNILSFPGDSTVPGILLLSLDTFFRELKLFGQKQNDHLLFLLCHGLLHLVGFDHGMEMDAMQNQCIAFIRKDMAQ